MTIIFHYATIILLLASINNIPANGATSSIVHPEIGTKSYSSDSSFVIELVQKKQNFTSALPKDIDICSPKSVNIHPSGNKYYINSLECGKTIVYSFPYNNKINVIKHSFTNADSILWAKPCGLWTFKHYFHNQKNFYGKPVESVFSHSGTYLWIPYYRRSFDINAQDPSAVAVIDTRNDRIVRLFETGPLPKMITVSNDNHYVAISHWGNNTVGLLDISSSNINNWHYTSKIAIDHELSLNLPLDSSINRDCNCGYCLRGTTFTLDNKYLLVGCMGGEGGIAVIDVVRHKYLGRITGMMSNIRHIIIDNGWIYLSINSGGYVQRALLSDIEKAINSMQTSGRLTFDYSNWKSCKVGTGARTIESSHDGKYLYVACNNVSRLYVIDTRSFKVITYIDVDSYPVGLDVSKDGRYVIVTSQGKNGNGGNAVNIYRVSYTQKSL